MPKFVALICAGVLAALTAASIATAGERADAEPAIYVPSDAARAALFQHVAAKPCCYNSGDFFNSSPSTCRKYGGRVVSYDYCEREYWPQWQGGYGINGKPCCWNNGQYFNATPGTCRKYGGTSVAQGRCNNYYTGQWGNGPWNGNGQWNSGGQWNNGYPQGGTNYGYPQGTYPQGTYNAEKPCCFNNGQYFGSTPSTCRKYGGQTVPQEYCYGGYQQRQW